MKIVRGDGLVLSDDSGLIDLDRVVAFLAQSYWAANRSPEIIAKSLAHSRPYGVYAPDGVQIAFARAVTDFATFCWIGDVFVDAAWRAKGIGHWMVGSLVEDLRGEGLNRFTLATKDAHSVYADLGFAPLADPTKWMEIDNRSVVP